MFHRILFNYCFWSSREKKSYYAQKIEIGGWQSQPYNFIATTRCYTYDFVKWSSRLTIWWDNKILGQFSLKSRKDVHKIDLSDRSVRRRLVEQNLYGQKARWKPLFADKQKSYMVLTKFCGYILLHKNLVTNKQSSIFTRKTKHNNLIFFITYCLVRWMSWGSIRS